jgi:hypothetical protein
VSPAEQRAITALQRFARPASSSDTDAAVEELAAVVAAAWLGAAGRCPAAVCDAARLALPDQLLLRGPRQPVPQLAALLAALSANWWVRGEAIPAAAAQLAALLHAPLLPRHVCAFALPLPLLHAVAAAPPALRALTLSHSCGHLDVAETRALAAAIAAQPHLRHLQLPPYLHADAASAVSVALLSLRQLRSFRVDMAYRRVDTLQNSHYAWPPLDFMCSSALLCAVRVLPSVRHLHLSMSHSEAPPPQPEHRGWLTDTVPNGRWVAMMCDAAAGCTELTAVGVTQLGDTDEVLACAARHGVGRLTLDVSEQLARQLRRDAPLRNAETAGLRELRCCGLGCAQAAAYLGDVPAYRARFTVGRTDSGRIPDVPFGEHA